MSGIAALRTGGAPAAASLPAMLAAMAHRGPDGHASWDAGPVALGHRRLGGAPQTGGQPAVRGELALIADCRIDNRGDLMRALGIRECDCSDADLIIRAYERWGEGCASHLLGDFAFVLWDGRRRVLVCARDHFGVKPLYYHRGAGMFAAASEIKGLFALSEVPRRVDERMVGDHLTGSFDDPEITYWQDIRRVPAAHTMTVDDSGAARLSRYWMLDPGREIRLGNDGEYAEALRELFIEAVRRRLPAGETVAASLSGGLDSTSVSTVAARHATASVHSISLTFPGLPSVDEQRWIKLAVHSGGFVPHAVRGDEIDPFELIDRMLVHEDGIFWAPNLYLHWAMYERASQTGARVFLDGLDGDSTLSHGLGHPRELLLGGHWRRAGREIRALARHTGRPLYRQARRVLLPNGTGLQTRLRRALGEAPQRPPAWDGFGIVAPAFAARMRVPERYEALSGHRRRPLRRERDAHYRQLEWPLHALALEAADRAAAAHGIEPRYPFYDVALVEFCLALPGAQKLRAGWTRWTMRRAMEGILPPAVQWRHGKSNLSPVLTHAIHRWGRPAVDELLRDPDGIGRYVDLRALGVRWERFRAQPSPADVMPIWLSLVLHRGLQVAAERWPAPGSAAAAATGPVGSPARQALAGSR